MIEYERFRKNDNLKVWSVKVWHLSEKRWRWSNINVIASSVESAIDTVKDNYEKSKIESVNHKGIIHHVERENRDE